MSSWKALAWAQDQEAGSPLAKLVLVLICARADERFSCGTATNRELAGECEASRSGVQLAIAALRKPLVRAGEHVRGPLLAVEVTATASGAQSANRYLINHPEAPHLAAQAVDNRPPAPVGNAAGGPTQSAGGAHSVGGGGPLSRPTGAHSVGGGGPLSRPQKTGGGNTTTSRAEELADVVVVEARARKISLTRPVVLQECDRLTAWSGAALRTEFAARSWHGVQGGAVVLWLRGLPAAPPAPEPEPSPDPRGPWCGYCSHPTARRALDPTSGAATAAPCPDCGGTA